MLKNGGEQKGGGDCFDYLSGHQALWYSVEGMNVDEDACEWHIAGVK